MGCQASTGVVVAQPDQTTSARDDLRSILESDAWSDDVGSFSWWRCPTCGYSPHNKCRTCGSSCFPVTGNHNKKQKVKNIALDESSAAIAKLTKLLGPTKRDSVQTIVTELASVKTSSAPVSLQQTRSVWSCVKCTFHNHLDLLACEICDAGRGDAPLLTKTVVDEQCQIIGEPENEDDDVANPADPESVIDEALEAVECPICLDVYNDPLTLPCGHSLCTRHAHNISNNKCPLCRKEFTRTERRAPMAKNAELAKHVKAVVRLAALVNPDRETVRHAALTLQVVLPEEP